MDTQGTRRQLLKLQSQLLGLEEGLSDSLGVSLEDQAGEETYDQHMGDVGTVTFDRELDLSLQGNAEHLLAKVKRALDKIDEGSYGLCDRCGRPIEDGRLRAAPYATLCMEHQRELERDLQG